MESHDLQHVLNAIEAGTIGERKRAVDRLREFPFEQIKHHLFEGLRSKHHRVRTQCALILAEKGDETIIFPLLQAMSDESWAIRDSAREALTHVSENTVIPALRGILDSSAGNIVLLRSIAHVLSSLDHPDATSILVKLFDGNDDPELIETVTTAIGKKEDDRSVNQLFLLLAHELWNVRKAAANAILRMPWDLTKNHLAKSLGNPNRFIHLATVEILIAKSDENVLDQMTETLSCSNMTAKMNAISILSGIHTDESMMIMSSALSDDNATIRNKVIEELAKCRSNAIVNLLKRCLNSSNQLLKSSAIKTFGMMGDENAFEILQSALEKETGSSKVQVLESIAQIGSRKATQIILRNSAIPDHADAVSKILRKLDPDLAIQQLINLLEEPDFFATAVKALIELDRFRVLRYLSAKLTSGTPAQQEKAVEAMGLLGSKDAIPYLEKILEGGFTPRIVQIAESAMRRIRKSG